MNSIYKIAENFTKKEKIISIQECGAGNINDTFLVISARQKFILQKINSNVYSSPEDIIFNMQALSAHLANNSKSDQFQVPVLLGHCLDDQHNFWRAISYIENSISVEQVTDENMASEAGRALGIFHKMLSGLEVTQLKDTLPGFHVTPLYLQKFDQAIASVDPTKLNQEERQAFDFINARRSFVSILENANLKIRVIHGDPKISNILFDRDNKSAISVIDLDTVKPGLLHYDIGDALRSCANPLGEDGELTAIYFDLNFCQAFMESYLKEAQDILTIKDYQFIPDAINLIPFELGLRFFTDHLQGDQYFKVKYHGHNLKRALVQFCLTTDIEKKIGEIRQICNKWQQ